MTQNTPRPAAPGRPHQEVRLVVGALNILLVVEDWQLLGWRVLDYFTLVSEHDRDLLLVTREMQRSGYLSGANTIKATLSAAVFSLGGVKDDEAKAAMARLGCRGFETSDRVVGIRDPKFLWWADGHLHHSRKRGSRV
jgi:hypothetical protein